MCIRAIPESFGLQFHDLTTFQLTQASDQEHEHDYEGSSTVLTARMVQHFNVSTDAIRQLPDNFCNLLTFHTCRGDVNNSVNNCE
jgi:hypothetical protein